MASYKKSTNKMDSLMDFSLCSDDQSLCHINANELNDSKVSNLTLKSQTRTNNRENLSFVNLNDEEYSLSDFYTSDSYMNRSNQVIKNDDSDSNSNGIELDHVKHKLSSLWNNVKYGFSNYINKTSKIELNKNEPVYILGKKFQSENNENLKTNPNLNVGNSSFYYLNANETSIPSTYSNIVKTSKPSFPINDELDFSSYYKPSTSDDISMTYSYLSTSPYTLTNEYVYNISASSNDTLSSTFNNLYLNKNLKTPLEQEVYSRLWFTYRKDFEPLNGNSKYTSDCGWGCMLRSAQMLIGQALIYHHFGNEWSLYKSLKSDKEIELYKNILSLFNDRSSVNCPFGLHNLLELADRNLVSQSTSRVGTWFGPTSVCTLIKDSLNQTIENKLLENITIYTAQDCTIFKPDLLKICVKDNKFIPCTILIPARLGGDSINEIYVETLKMYLEMENCLGIIGGKPKHSLYFFGYQGDKVLFLDPHLCQPTINIYSSEDNKNENFDNKSFHCSNAGRISFTKLDPSIAIGFYFKSLEELNKFCDFTKANQKSEYFHSIFGVCDESFEKLQSNCELFSLEDKMVNSRSETSKKKSPHKHKEKSPKQTKRYFNKLMLSNNLNSTKLWNGTTTTNGRSSSTSNLNKNRTKSNDQDDFVLV